VKSVFKRWLLAFLAPALIATSAPVAVMAQEDAAVKPLVVVSVASVKDLLDNVGYLTKAAGFEDIGNLVNLMAGGYTNGITPDQPWGAIVTSDGNSASPLGFIPVTNLAALEQTLTDQLGQAPEDLGGGVKQIGDAPPVFFKEQGGWVFIAQSADQLANLPQDPAGLLDGLNKEYSIAIRANVNNIPGPFKQLAISAIQAGFDASSEQSGGNDLQKQLGEQQIKQLQTLIEETDTVTIGWVVDPEKKNTHFDISMTGIAGSKIARQMSALKEQTSAFSGFRMSDAAAYLSFTGPIAKEDMAQVKETLKLVRQNAMQEIGNDDNLSDKAAQSMAKNIVGTMFDVITATLEAGKIDGGAALLLKPGALTFVGGGFVADVEKIEKTFKGLVDLLKVSEPDFPGIKLDAVTHQGVRFHTMNLPIPEEDARKVLGDELEVAIGFGTDSIYLAVGADAIGTIKSVIDKSAADKDKKVTPVEMTVGISSILKFAAATDASNPILAKLAEAAGNTESDHVSVRMLPVERGVTYQITVEEGVINIIGKGIQAANGG